MGWTTETSMARRKKEEENEDEEVEEEGQDGEKDKNVFEKNLLSD